MKYCFRSYHMRFYEDSPACSYYVQCYANCVNRNRPQIYFIGEFLMSVSEDLDNLDLAVIGMNGQFPQADNLEAFWQNLQDGVESITFFSDQELIQRGVNRQKLLSNNFVKAAPTLEDIDLFAASFFGYSPREAELMDPQHRLFLECAWEAMTMA